MGPAPDGPGEGVMMTDQQWDPSQHTGGDPAMGPADMGGDPAMGPADMGGPDAMGPADMGDPCNGTSRYGW